MKIIGITGNAGAGKSAAVDYFRSLGIRSIIADELNARLLLDCQVIRNTIEKISHQGILSPNGELDKARLREAAFSSKTFRKKLEQLLHPIIMDNMGLQIALLPEQPYCIVEIPLLFEADLSGWVDRIILITADQQILLDRLRKRYKVERDVAESILKNQLEDTQKISASDDIVLNTQDLESLHKQLELLHRQYI